jgi:hypothetical protein
VPIVVGTVMAGHKAKGIDEVTAYDALCSVPPNVHTNLYTNFHCTGFSVNLVLLGTEKVCPVAWFSIPTWGWHAQSDLHSLKKS